MKKTDIQEFNFPTVLETSYASSSGIWDEVEIMPDGLYCNKFYISDFGEVIVEMTAYDSEANEHKEVHISLSKLKEIITDVEDMALKTFDEGMVEKEPKS